MQNSNDANLTIQEYDEQYSITQTIQDLPAIIVNLSRLLAQDNLDLHSRELIMGQITLIHGMLEMFTKLNSLSFHE